MTRPVDMWQRDFGNAYTLRNEVDWHSRLDAFSSMFKGLDISSVLEVGCNRGHNLKALSMILPKTSAIVGVDPNDLALKTAAEVGGVSVGKASGDDLPFEDGVFDIVFTAGVLIHIPPSELEAVLHEILRVSRRYILAIEYYASEKKELLYRGLPGLLWKRDYAASYISIYADLRILRKGFWNKEEGFDDCHWWLMEKQAS